MMKTYAIPGLLAATLLAGCAPQRPIADAGTNEAALAEQDARMAYMSAKLAETIKVLPPDADLESITEQVSLVSQGMYLTWDGERRYLNPADAPKTVSTAKVATPKAVRIKPAPIKRESIRLEDVPAPINID